MGGIPFPHSVNVSMFGPGYMEKNIMACLMRFTV